MKLINKNQKIFIAGHKGMAGKAICKSLKNNGYQNVLTVDRSKLDLMKYGDVKDFLSFEKLVISNSCCKSRRDFCKFNYPLIFY